MTNRNLVSVLENSFRQHAELAAIDATDGSLTYRELNNASLRLAIELQSRFSPEELKSKPVAIMMSRALELYVAQIAVLRAGGFFLSIDLKQPQSRIEYLLDDSQSLVLLRRNGDGDASEAEDPQPFPQTEQMRVDIHDLRGSVDESESSDGLATSGESESGLQPQTIQEDDLAYLVYTSGSTGKPKGVAIHHAAVWHLVNWCVPAFEKTTSDRGVQFTSPGFDVAVEEVFSTLAAGACLVPVDRSVVHSTNEFLNWLDRNRITILQVPTAFWHMLTEGLDSYTLPRSLRLVIFGGESARESSAAKWFELVTDRVKLINAYGPSETTVSASYKILQPRESVTIGTPLPYLTFFIVDQQGKIVADGEDGELYIGGASVGKGYWRREALTAERFVRCDFFPDGLCYRTGDRARCVDGEYDILGRFDDQVKICGHRVEPNEIAHTLSKIPHVSQAFVQPVDIGGTKQLVAYLTPRAGTVIDTDQLKDDLARQLPAYMVPTRWLVMKSFPLTERGKIDRNGFPNFYDEVQGGHDSLLDCTIQQSLATIWKTVLGVPVSSPDDHFFELGGNSLSAMDLVLRIEREFNLVVPVAVLIPNPTIQGLANFIEHHEGPNDTRPAEPQNSSRRPNVTRMVDESAEAQFVYLHAAGGGGIFYRQLYQKLSKPQSALILESPFLYDANLKQVTIGSFADIAEAYVDEVILQGFTSELTLVGYSFGGILAIEMADQLARRGIKVKKIVNIDSPNPLAVSPRPWLGRVLMNAKKASRPAHLFRQLRKLRSRTVGFQKIRQLHQNNQSIPLEYRSLAIESIYRQLEGNFQNTYFDGPMHLIRSTESESKLTLPEDYGWGEWVETLHVTNVPGDHLSIFLQPWLPNLQDAFREAIEGGDACEVKGLA